MTDLIKLAERVEAEDTLTYSDVLTPLGIDWAAWAENKNSPVISLDAAKALHDAVLPGWLYGIVQKPNWCEVGVYKDNGYTDIQRGQSPTPAAAWVAAILRAKASQ